MARQPRLLTDTGKYHVILRGNNRQNLFYKDIDRTFFLNRLRKYSKQLGIYVYTFCLMPNHVHLLIGNASPNLSLFIQKLANSYVYYFNRKYERSGHLFQGRFKSEPINSNKYFKTVFRYILQNCEKAQICDFKQYKWNNYHQLIKQEYDKNILNEIFSLFSSFDYFKSFINSKSPLKDKPMEYENKIFLSDDHAFKIIKKLFNVSSPYKLNRLPVDEIKSKSRILKQTGLSINQISRLTGISRGLIKAS